MELVQNRSVKDLAEVVEEGTGDQDDQNGLEGDDDKMPANEDVVMDPTREDDIGMDFAVEDVVGGDGNIGLHNNEDEEMDGTALEDQVCNVIIIQRILMLIIVYQRQIVPLT